MAYTTTLGEARNNSSIRGISGVCADSQRFADQVNDVTRKLMRRGSWYGTEVLMRVCLEGCRFVWPRQIGTVLGIKFCHGQDIPIRNAWWSIAGVPSCGWRGSATMSDENSAPCYREITGNDGKFIKWHITKLRDVGKTIRLYGFQYGNQPLQEKNAAGAWIPGITLTAANTGAQTTIAVTKITSVKIPTAMEGMNYLYQVDQSTGDLLDLAAYQPGESSPAYRVSTLNGISSICAKVDMYGRHIRQAEVLVKLQYIPALVDEDFLMLDNLDALKLGIQSLRMEDANDDVGAQLKLALAIKELNMELRDRNPSAQTAIRTNDLSMSSACFSNPI